MVWTAAFQQHKVNNQLFVFRHHKAVVYPWEYWNKVLVTRCFSWHQLNCPRLIFIVVSSPQIESFGKFCEHFNFVVSRFPLMKVAFGLSSVKGRVHLKYSFWCLLFTISSLTQNSRPACFFQNNIHQLGNCNDWACLTFVSRKSVVGWILSWQI